MPREAADAPGRATCGASHSITGVALAVLLKLIDQKKIGPKERVVVVSTANGLKFTDFKVAYHDKKLEGMAAPYANRPVELPNDYDAVRRALDSL